MVDEQKQCEPLAIDSLHDGASRTSDCKKTHIGFSELSPDASPTSAVHALTPATLTLIGTPLGNLGDLSSRAIAALRDADIILCEDTRVTRRLTAHVKSKARLVRADEHSLRKGCARFVELISQGHKAVYCSDAGMPCLSDPGAQLVEACYEAAIPVDIIPGPTALSAAIALSGFECSHLLFMGFAPRKDQERQALFTELRSIFGVQHTVNPALVFYESPVRVNSLFKSLAQEFPHRQSALIREITKVHQEVVRGTTEHVLQSLLLRPSIKGECVVVLAPQEATCSSSVFVSKGLQVTNDVETPGLLGDAIDSALLQGEPKKEIAKRIAHTYGIRRQEAYNLIVARARHSIDPR